MHRRIVGSLMASSALDGFSPINIAQGLESSQRRHNAYRYVRQSENMASDFMAAPLKLFPITFVRTSTVKDDWSHCAIGCPALSLSGWAQPNDQARVVQDMPIALMLRLHGTRDSLLAALTAHWPDQQLQLPSGINPTAARPTASCYGPWDSAAASPQTSAGSRSLA